MRLQQDVRHDHFTLQFRMFSLLPRILMAADVEPRPAVKSALLNMRDVIRHQVVAQPVALVHRCPQFAGGGIHGDAHRIADALRVNAPAAAIRIELQDVGAMEFLRVVIGIVVIGMRTHRDEHFAAIAE